MTMELLNRSAVIVKPLRPYLEWAKGDDALWPKNRTPQMFQEWFEIQMSSMVQDLDSYTPLELI